MSSDEDELFWGNPGIVTRASMLTGRRYLRNCNHASTRRTSAFRTREGSKKCERIRRINRIASGTPSLVAHRNREFVVQGEQQKQDLDQPMRLELTPASFSLDQAIG